MVIVPRIHLNGTSREDLLDEQREVISAADGLLLALHRASPNARDFYPLESGTFESAVAAHQKRVAAVEKVVEEARALFNGIFEQRRR